MAELKTAAELAALSVADLTAELDANSYTVEILTEALALENAKGDDARKTAVAALTEALTAAQAAATSDDTATAATSDATAAAEPKVYTVAANKSICGNRRIFGNGATLTQKDLPGVDLEHLVDVGVLK